MPDTPIPTPTDQIAQAPVVDPTNPPGPGTVPPVQADDTATKLPPSSQSTIESRIGSITDDLKDELSDAVGKAKDEFGSLGDVAKDIGRGLSKAGSSVLRTAGKATDVLENTGSTASDETEKASNTIDQESDKFYGQPLNTFHAAVSGITEFTALSALTHGVGGEEMASGKFAKAVLRTNKVSTLMTMGSDPRTEDFLSTHFRQADGNLGRFFGRVLAANPSDPEWLAYTRSYARNLLSNAAIEAVQVGGAAVWSAMRGAKMAEKVIPPTGEFKDVATIASTPEGSHVVTDNEGSETPRPVATFATRGEAEVEVAARNESAEQEQIKARGGNISSADKEAYANIGEAVAKNAHPRIIQQLVDHHGLVAPYGLDEPGLINHLTEISKALHMPPAEEGVKSDGQLALEAARSLDPDANHAQMVQRFSDWFGQTKNVDSKIVAAKIYLKTLGAQAAKLGEAHSVAPIAPTARENLQNVWQTMQQVYVALRGTGTELGRGVRAFRPEVGMGEEAGDQEASVTSFGEGDRAGESAATVEKALEEHRTARKSVEDELASGEKVVGKLRKATPKTTDTDVASATAMSLARARARAQAIIKAHGETVGLSETDRAAQAIENAKRINKAADAQRASPLEATEAQRASQENPINTLSKNLDSEDAALQRIVDGYKKASAKSFEISEPQPSNIVKLARVQNFNILDDRALGQFARNLRMAGGDPAGMLDAVHQAMLENGVNPAEVAAKRAEGMTTGQKTAKSIATYAINNMISGPTTVARVMTGQAIMTAKLPIEYFAGGMLRMAKGVLTGLKEDDIKAGASMLHKSFDLGTGQLMNLGEGLRAGARAFKAGDSLIDPGQAMFPGGKVNPELLDLGPLQWLYYPMTAPSRLHTSITEFTKTLNYRAYVRMQSLADSRLQGLSSTEAAQAYADDLKASFDPNGKAILNAEALYEGRRSTFTLPLQQGTIGKGLNDILSKSPILRLIIAPFQKVATNIMRENWAMVPGLGSYQGYVHQAMEAGGDQAAKAYGNQLLGSAIAAWAIHMASTGRLTGRGPADPELRKQLTDTGWQPHAILAGGYYHSINQVEPFSTLANIPADVHDVVSPLMKRLEERKQYREDADMNKHVYLKDHPPAQHLRQIADFVDATRGSNSEDGMHVLSAIVASIASSAANKSYLSSMSKAMDVMTSQSEEEGSHAVENMLSDWAAEAVPGSKFFEHLLTDPSRREARGMIQHLAQRVPGWSQTLESHRNIFGEKSVLPPGFLDWANGHINPFQVTNANADPLVSKLLAMGGPNGMPMPKEVEPGADGMTPVNWRDRDADESGQHQSPYDRMLELMSQPIFDGKTSRQTIQDLVSSDDFKSLPDYNPMDADSPRFELVASVFKELAQFAQQKVLSEARYRGFARAKLGASVVRSVAKFAGDSAAHEAYRSLMQGDISNLGGPQQKPEDFQDLKSELYGGGQR